MYWQTYLPDGITKLHQVHVGMSSENKSGISKKKLIDHGSDHCIDAIRQYIQCHMDMTPINLVWSENKGGILPDFRQTHTCKSYHEAHEWVLRRNIANYEYGIGDEGVADDARRTLEEMGWA